MDNLVNYRSIVGSGDANEIAMRSPPRPDIGSLTLSDWLRHFDQAMTMPCRDNPCIVTPQGRDIVLLSSTMQQVLRLAGPEYILHAHLFRLHRAGSR